jgi:hypothetical protein
MSQTKRLLLAAALTAPLVASAAVPLHGCVPEPYRAPLHARGGQACDERIADAVNPQPLPPRGGPRVAINPQPLPPGGRGTLTA